jgi:hypothetical protein
MVFVCSYLLHCHCLWFAHALSISCALTCHHARLVKKKVPKTKGKGRKGTVGDSEDGRVEFDTGYLAFEYHAAIVAATALLYPAMAAAKKTIVSDSGDHARLQVCAAVHEHVHAYVCSARTLAWLRSCRNVR